MLERPTHLLWLHRRTPLRLLGDSVLPTFSQAFSAHGYEFVSTV